MSKQRQQSASATLPDDAGDGRSTVGLLLESILWIWALSVMGYFYYTRDFHLLLIQAWEQGLG